MYCTECGHTIKETAPYCGFCGADLQKQTDPAEKGVVSPISGSPAPPPLKKTGVTAAVVLTLLTSGLYAPIWYLRRLKSFNDSTSGSKLSAWPFLVALGILAGAIIIGTLAELPKELLPVTKILKDAETLKLASMILQVAVALWFLYPALKVRAILAELQAGKDEHPTTVSWFWTILLGFWYLQYKMNRL